MKAYIDKAGKVRMFRPEDNMRRMNTSAQRLALPVLGMKHLIVFSFPHNLFMDSPFPRRSS